MTAPAFSGRNPLGFVAPPMRGAWPSRRACPPTDVEMASVERQLSSYPGGVPEYAFRANKLSLRR